MHMFAGVIRKGRNIQAFINNHLVEVDHIGGRHDELVREMESRGYHHKSPIGEIIYDGLKYPGFVDRVESMKLLLERCKRCRSLALKIKCRKIDGSKR